MQLSGEYIRQTALEREQACPAAMKESFYYGFREGAKWALKETEDEISDETIMTILNCIGYEEASWIPYIRQRLEYLKEE